MKPNKKLVGERIKLIRISKGFTQETFGKLFNVDKASACKWEKGITLPNAERIASICKIADITVAELLYGNSKKDLQEIEEALMEIPTEKKVELFLRVLRETKTEEERKEEIERKKQLLKQ